MSEPILIGPPPPSRHEWRAMQEFLTSRRGDASRVETALEQSIATVVGRPFGVAFSTPTLAIEASLAALGVDCGTEIVAPALAPIALAAAAARVGARVLYADVDPKSLTLRELHASARLTSTTRAIVGCALHGQSAGLDALASLASRNELPLLEILWGGLGGRIGRDPVGRFGRIAVIPLGDRESPIGGGGAVCVTNDDGLAHTLRVLRNLGAVEPRNEWERIGGIARPERRGFDGHINPLGAALACVRLEHLDETCERLDAVFHAYLRRLAMHPDLVLPAPCVDGTVRWSHFAVRLGERYSRDDRDSVVQGLLRHDIAATSVGYALPLEPAFSEHHSPGDFPVAERAADRLIALPFSAMLGEREIDLVCQTLQVMIERQSIMRH